MKAQPPAYVTDIMLARVLFMDVRTLRIRLDALNIEPDARMVETTSATPLFDVTRIPAIRDEVGAIIQVCGIDVGITSPIFSK